MINTIVPTNQEMETPSVSPHTLQLLMAQEISDILPRFLPSEDLSDENSLGKSQDSDSSLDDTEEETKIEDILNSSDTNVLLDTLKIKIYSENTDSDSSHEHILEDASCNRTSNTLPEQDEFPLFNNHNILNNNIVLENEYRLSSPDKPKNGDFMIAGRTRGAKKSETSIPTKDTPTTIKSRIPLPTSNTTSGIRRSRRILDLAETETLGNYCTPKKLSVMVKPAIKPNVSTLNFIVNSSSGQLSEATKYATEINAANSEGIIIPQTPDELVSIPVRGSRKSSKQNKMALVTAYKYTQTKSEGDFTSLGFYSEKQHRLYFSSDESPAKIAKGAHGGKNGSISPKKAKKLRWAHELEW